MNKREFNIHIFAFLSMLFWGMSYVWTKMVLEFYNPLSTIFLRLLLSTIFLFVFLFISGQFVNIKKRDYLLFLLSALFNPFLYFLGENFGISLVTPTVSSIIIATIPLFTPLAAIIAFKSRITVFNILGILLSFTGVLIMILNRDLSLNASPRGIIYLFGAVVAAVFYTITLKILSSKYKPVAIIAYQNLIGIFYFLPLFLIFDWNNFIAVTPDRNLVFNVLALSIFASSLAFIFYTIAVKNLGMTKANVYTNLIPVFAAITSYFLLNEKFDIYKIGGGIVVIAGLIISQLRYEWISKRMNKK